MQELGRNLLHKPAPQSEANGHDILYFYILFLSPSKLVFRHKMQGTHTLIHLALKFLHPIKIYHGNLITRIGSFAIDEPPLSQHPIHSLQYNLPKLKKVQVDGKTITS
jgi:hypothetical protein